MRDYLRFTIAFLLATATAQNTARIQHCGLEECRLPLPVGVSCEYMLDNYNFLGSCCAMESIPETRGCRVIVAGRGNCAWVPKCGICDADDPIRCNFEFQTDSNISCPFLDFDGLAGGPVTFPPLGNSSSPPLGNSTEFPTSMPTMFENVTCPPDTDPESPGGGNSSDESSVPKMALSSVWSIAVGIVALGI